MPKSLKYGLVIVALLGAGFLMLQALREGRILQWIESFSVQETIAPKQGMLGEDGAWENPFAIQPPTTPSQQDMPESP